MSFAALNLHPTISKAIHYPNPTPVQAQSIPPILEGKDVVVSAQTGTGKTAAFVLPALHRLSTQKPVKKPRILILTPTRELATQIDKAVKIYGKHHKFNIANLVGGMSYHYQIKDLSRGPDIIVATPGRLMDHMENKRVDLSHIEMLILDEADRMLDMGFIEDVQYIAKQTPERRQTLLFSATVDKHLVNVVKHLLKNPVRIDLSSEKISSPQIKQEMYRANNVQHKSRLLKHFLNDANIYKAIIFSATKAHADKLANELRNEGYLAAALHGDLRQNVRNRTVEQLRRGKIQFLVATDVAARGIDISDVTHVINFDLPKFCEDYVHRIGRTGRAGKSGVAISFVLPADNRHLQRIERYIGQRIKLKHESDLGQIATAKNDRLAQEDHHPREEREFHRHPRKHQDANEKQRGREKNSSTAKRNDRYAFKNNDRLAQEDHHPREEREFHRHPRQHQDANEKQRGREKNSSTAKRNDRHAFKNNEGYKNKFSSKKNEWDVESLEKATKKHHGRHEKKRFVTKDRVQANDRRGKQK